MIAPNENMKPSVAYARCSTDEQPGSIDDQRREIRRVAQEEGFEILDRFTDRGISGTRTDTRPEYNRMKDEARRENPRFRYILVRDLSRFSRGDPYEAMAELQFFRSRGIEVIPVTEPLPGSDMDAVFVSVKQTLAHSVVKGTSKDTIRNQVDLARKGWRMGGKAPFGFDLEFVSREGEGEGEAVARLRYMENGQRQLLDTTGNLTRTFAVGERHPKPAKDRVRLVLSTPERVAVVKRIFQMYVHEGRGYKEIVKILNQKRIPSPGTSKSDPGRNAGWYGTMIKNIIEDPVYVGEAVWNRNTYAKLHRISDGRPLERGAREKGTRERNDEKDLIVVPNAHPAITDRTTFEAARKLQGERRRKHQGPPHLTGRAKTSRYLLSGLIKCSLCGRNFSGQPRNKGKRRKDGSKVQTFYYVCGGYLNGGHVDCKRGALPQDAIEHEVLKYIEQRVEGFLGNGGDGLLRKMLRKSFESVERNWKDERRKIKRRVAKIDIDVDRLLDSVTPAIKFVVEKKILKLQEEQGELTAQLEELEKRESQAINVDAFGDEIVATMRQFNRVFEEGELQEKKEFVNLFVERIEVDPEEKKARVYIRQFPAPESLDTGKCLLVLVAGARCAHQKTLFPPIDVVEMALACRGRGATLVPAPS